MLEKQTKRLVALRLTEETIEKLEALAAYYSITKTEIMQNWLENAIKADFEKLERAGQILSERTQNG